MISFARQIRARQSLPQTVKTLLHASRTRRASLNFPRRGLQHQSPTLIKRRDITFVMPAKISDAELVEAAIEKLEGAERHTLVDVGINLADSSYDKDRAAVIERAKRAGVAAMIVTGCDLKTSIRAKAIATEHEGVYFTTGVHPHNAKNCDNSTVSTLRQLAASERCVAIGECGLDFNRNFSPPDVQEHWFNEQVQLAVELRKPLFLHCRDAGERFAAILRQHTLTAPAVAHCFTGSSQELQELLSLGLYIGITGWVCDDRPDRGGHELANLLPEIPKDRMMIETDGPYLTPRTIMPSKARPRRNEPALLPLVLQKVAQHLNETEKQVAERTTAAACDFFGIKV